MHLCGLPDYGSDDRVWFALVPVLAAIADPAGGVVPGLANLADRKWSKTSMAAAAGDGLRNLCHHGLLTGIHNVGSLKWHPNFWIWFSLKLPCSDS